MNEETILHLKNEITELERLLVSKKRQLEEMQSVSKPDDSMAGINNTSLPQEKIALFRLLFRGREDVYAKRWESKKIGKSGYQPVCRNEWEKGFCEKPKISCNNCKQRSLEPVTDAVTQAHLKGSFVMGIYPLLKDETCNFLAIDFDKASWREDVLAFWDTCELENIPAAIERSRSGNGAHIWIFFNEPVQAVTARKLGSFLLTKTMDRRPEVGLDSFDRFFPNQDTLPKGGFGNLIALPLQQEARKKNHSVFVDKNFSPYPDQWAFLSSIKTLTKERLNNIVQNAALQNEILPVTYNADEDDTKPWKKQSDALPAITEQTESWAKI